MSVPRPVDLRTVSTYFAMFHSGRVYLCSHITIVVSVPDIQLESECEKERYPAEIRSLVTSGWVTGHVTLNTGSLATHTGATPLSLLTACQLSPMLH